MWFSVVCTLVDNEYTSLLFSQTFFFLLFLHVERVCHFFIVLFIYWLKVLEGFEGLTQVHSLFVGKNKITKLEVGIPLIQLIIAKFILQTYSGR